MDTKVRIPRLFVRVITLLVLIATLTGAGFAAAKGDKTGYEYYVVGNAGDVTTATTAGLLLMGGGPDVDEAFQWMSKKSGGGDFVVIRASGTDAYNPYIYAMGLVDSVETLIIKTRAAASDPFVVDKIRKAEALFIAGGDQYDYVKYWKGTPVEDAIHSLVKRNVPIGGTSAGLAILGEFLFSAQNGTVYSDDALANPYNRRVTLDRDFLTLPNMGKVITDGHLDYRDRMGRLVTFLARIVQDGWSAEAKGIGIDVETAIAVENGTASLFGTGAAYFLRTPGMPEVCQDRTPLTFRNLSVQRLSGSSGTFNVKNWSGNDTTNYTLSAEEGVLTSTQVGGGIY
ncbi:MAG: cyanophycinase [Sulfuricella sp.]|nr:cyanophycinase [Sulfuricella sp.]